MDDLQIDGHKLMYHIPRLHQWLKGEEVYPIYIEVGPSGRCNHRCIFCAFDYLGYESPFLETDVLQRALTEAGARGVRSVLFAGEGEPLLHKDMADLVGQARQAGLDVAITTNGVFLDAGRAREMLGSLTWVRVSLDAGTAETYARVHGCSPDQFRRVLHNLRDAVRLKREKNHLCTIGTQLLLLPENWSEVTTLAAQLREIGVDYLSVKPFSQHPLSYASLDPSFHYRDLAHLEQELREQATDTFRVIFRRHAMEKLETGERPYERCLGLPFFAYIDSRGNVYACSAYLGKEEFCYGNIHQQSFGEIWEGPRRREVRRMVETELDVTRCRVACRLDEINRYLWALKHPPVHVNFI